MGINIDAVLGETGFLTDQDGEELPEQLVHDVEAFLPEVLPVDCMAHEQKDCLDTSGVRSIVHLRTTFRGVGDGDTRRYLEGFEMSV